MKILITGATSGIGFKTGIELIKKGHFVYFTVHKNSEIKTVIDKLKNYNFLEKASVFKLDITNKKDQKIITTLDIDCLICNAAVGYGGSVLDIDIKTLEDNFKVNVFSNIELIQKYSSNLILNNKKGKIVVISSIAGITPIPFLGSYCATKSSLITLTTCLKHELKLITKDIKVKLIEPGVFNTGFNEVMIENKKESFYFKKIANKITYSEEKIFKILGHDNLDCIVKKIVKATLSDSNRLIYSSPFFQKLGARIYAFFN